VRSQPKAPLASLHPNALKSCSIRYSNFNNLACFKPDIACCPRSPSITHSRCTGDTTGHHPCLECPCRRGGCEQIDVLELNICSNNLWHGLLPRVWPITREPSLQGAKGTCSLKCEREYQLWGVVGQDHYGHRRRVRGEVWLRSWPVKNIGNIFDSKKRTAYP
jgi:hypothetical protein